MMVDTTAPILTHWAVTVLVSIWLKSRIRWRAITVALAVLAGAGAVFLGAQVFITFSVQWSDVIYDPFIRGRIFTRPLDEEVLEGWLVHIAVPLVLSLMIVRCRRDVRQVPPSCRP